MLYVLGLFTSCNLTSIYLASILLFLFLYYLYYKKYSFYIFKQKKSFTKGKHLIGKTPPPYPNGWFFISRSSEIKRGETKYIDLHGDNIALFRGTNGKVYALHAYCAHKGANLGIAGVVTNEKCIRCPFHGWVFDGETGFSVIGKKGIKEGITYEYNNDEEGKWSFQQKCDSKYEKINIKKYIVQEKCGYVFVWFHAKDIPPEYEPLDISPFINKLSYRGSSLNIVKSHIQDITENGGDLMHFLYIHSEIIPYLVKGYWDAKWLRADDPELKQKMKHDNKTFNEYRMNLLNSFITEENKKYIGVIHLDNHISVLGSKSTPFFCLTGFQVGPGLVYLFLKSHFFETILFHHVDTVKKYEQHVYHEIYCSPWNPYWFSALQLRLEVSQVLKDGVIWDNKKFSMSPVYCTTNEADLTLINWRSWYSQFYNGCKITDEEKSNYEW